MEKHLQDSEKLNKRKRCARDVKSICAFNYEDNSDFRVESNVNSSVIIPFRENSSKKTIELSLEVEIANSLKQLITSPEKYDSRSPLLDVTIVRPTDLDCVRGLEASSSSFTRSEVRNLIASMERQKQHKRRLIEVCKKQVAASMMNPIIEIQETTGRGGSKHLFVRKNDQLSSKRRRHDQDHIDTLGNPTKATINYRLDTLHTTAKGGTVDRDSEQQYIDSASISILKPLVGEIRQSLKHLEAKIVEGGDHHSKEIKTKRYKTHYLGSASSSPNFSNDSLDRGPGKRNTHQIYTTANTFEKLRNLLACKNSERNDRTEREKERPCLCQHCGMIGLLIDSQKGPVVPTFPLDSPDLPYSRTENRQGNDKNSSDYTRIPHRELTKSRQKISGRPRNSEDNYRFICSLSSKLEELESRISAQEQNTVPKDYFKRIINRILNSHSAHASGLENKMHSKNNWTQCSVENLDDIDCSRHYRYEPRVKHKNVQIQQNTRRNYLVNPVLIQTDSEPPSPSLDSQVTAIEDDKKNVGDKAMCAINDFFAKLGSDKENAVKPVDTKKTKLKEPDDPIEGFWRWGEEIIKPGIDLKTKILSLFDEQFQNPKQSILIESKDISSKSTKLQNSLHQNFRSNATSPINFFEAPKPFEDKEEPKQYQQCTKFSLSNSSSQALKKVLDLMSEKIYNDHVKPTADAMKKEQKSSRKENTDDLHSIKAAMNAAFYNMNNKEPHILHAKHEQESPLTADDRRYRKKYVEPLRSADKKDNETQNSILKSQNLSRRSAIPIRISNVSPTDSATSGNAKYKDGQKSLIPRLKSPIKECSNERKQIYDVQFKGDNSQYINKTHKEAISEYLRKTKRKEEHDKMNVKNCNNVKITYMNPKVGIWNEESSGSVPVATCQGTNKATLTDNTSSSSDKQENVRTFNKEQKRRITQEHSITEKLAILTNIASTEMEKAQLWNKIWNQAKSHCKSKQDTVIIQVPTKRNGNHNVVGVTEVEFTLEDIQKLVNDPKLIQSIENLPQKPINCNNPGNMESFLLIRSRKILEDVHKRLGNKFLRYT